MAVGIKIAEQRIADITQAFRPGGQACCAVYADTQNLGIYPIKPVECDLVRWDLTSSDRRPGQGEESQDDIFLTQVIAQADFLSQVAFQAKIGGNLTNF
jgi:hypothetical protein